MNDDTVYLGVRIQNSWDFLRYICNGGAGKGQGERPPQTDIPEDGVPDDESCRPFSRGGGRFGDPTVPVSGPVVMRIPVRRTSGVPPHSISEEPPPLG